MKDLKVEMQLSSTESMKSYLLHSDCLAFVSVYSVLNELRQNDFRIIDIKGLDIERYFYFIRLQGESESLTTIFMNFSRHYNFR